MHLGQSRLQRCLRGPLRRLLRCGAPRHRLRHGARRALRTRGPEAAAERGKALGFGGRETWEMEDLGGYWWILEGFSSRQIAQLRYLRTTYLHVNNYIFPRFKKPYPIIIGFIFTNMPFPFYSRDFSWLICTCIEASLLCCGGGSFGDIAALQHGGLCGSIGGTMEFLIPQKPSKKGESCQARKIWEFNKENIGVKPTNKPWVTNNDSESPLGLHATCRWRSLWIQQ